MFNFGLNRSMDSRGFMYAPRSAVVVDELVLDDVDVLEDEDELVLVVDDDDVDELVVDDVLDVVVDVDVELDVELELVVVVVDETLLRYRWSIWKRCVMFPDDVWRIRNCSVSLST